MKKSFFIWFLIPFISCCQTNSEFVYKNSVPVEWGKTCISEVDCFYLSLDSTLVFDDDDIYDYNYSLYYSYGNKKKQQIDSGYWSDLGYSLTLHSFMFEKNNSYVVLWESEYESYSFFTIYYLYQGMIVKIGVWGFSISRIIYGCEYCNYPVEDIRIINKDNEIEFSFVKDVDFMVITEDFDFDHWGTFDAGELTVSFNINDGMIRKVEKKK